MFKLTRKSFYILLFSILWLITAFSSFFHAVEFFELSNVTWMGIILAMAFEIGQASVLMSILTSSQDRKKYTPWILMCILTLVQIIGNVYSSYKYIMLNSPENLRYFKEPIFIWTQLPDAEATVIITYVSAAILPIVALLMTSMITNYLSDQSEDNNKPLIDKETAQELPQITEEFENPLISQNSILQMENQGLTESNKKKDDEIEQLKKQLEEAKNNEKLNTQQELTNLDEERGKDSVTKDQSDNDTNGGQSMGDVESQPSTIMEESSVSEKSTKHNEEESVEELEEKSDKEIIKDQIKKPSHFINL